MRSYNLNSYTHSKSTETKPNNAPNMHRFMYFWIVLFVFLLLPIIMSANSCGGAYSNLVLALTHIILTLSSLRSISLPMLTRITLPYCSAPALPSVLSTV